MKRPSSATTWLAGASLAAGVWWAGPISAAPVAVGPASSVDTTTIHEYRTDFGAWFVADLSDPVTPAPIDLDAGGGAGSWELRFTQAQGNPAPQTGDEFIVQELLRFSGGDIAFDDWQQQILTTGWAWTSATIFDNATATTLAGLQVDLTSDVVRFTFDPLAAGTEFFVVKTVQYVGAAGTAPTFPLVVRASTVPEPAGIALTLAGVGAFAVTRRRRRA